MSTGGPTFLNVGAGEFIIREGDAGSDMYIIESGAVDIVRGTGPERLAQLGPGDFFGEMAVLEDQPRFASAVARADSRLLKVDRAAFSGLLTQNVEIAIRIMRKLVARLRRAEERADQAQAEVAMARGSAAAAAAPVAASPAPPPSKRAGAPSEGGVLLHRGSGRRFPLASDRTEYLVGRTDAVTGFEPEINLGGVDDHRTLSRRHAKILREGEDFFLREEVGTTNGTFINGQRLKTGVAVPLKPGDKVRFGVLEVEFEEASK